MGRRTSLASLAGAKVEAVPGSSTPVSPTAEPITAESATAAGLTVVQRIPLSAIVATPLNSRQDFGSQDDLREFGESLLRNQLQAVVVVPRDDYLQLWPEHADATATGEFVLAAGERRWRGLQAVNAHAIDAVIRPGIAESKLIFLDAVFTENFARKNLDAIEEANAIEELVKVLGTARAVAEYYGKTEGWASQRRKLLQLDPAMQRLVSRGEMPIAVARDICKLPTEEQEHAWLGLKNAPAALRKPRVKPEPEPAGPQNFTAVKSEDPPSAHTASDDGQSQPESEPAEPQNFTAVKPTEPSADPDSHAAVPAQSGSAESAGPQNFTAVKSEGPPSAHTRSTDSAGTAQQSIWSALATVDPTDIKTLARVIRQVQTPRESYALAEALLDLLKRVPDLTEEDLAEAS